MAATRGGYEAVISGSALPLNLLCLAFRHASFEASPNIFKASVYRKATGISTLRRRQPIAGVFDGFAVNGIG